MYLNFVEEGATVFFGLGIVNKHPATFAGDTLGPLFILFAIALAQGCAATNALTFG